MKILGGPKEIGKAIVSPPEAAEIIAISQAMDKGTGSRVTYIANNTYQAEIQQYSSTEVPTIQIIPRKTTQLRKERG